MKIFRAPANQNDHVQSTVEKRMRHKVKMSAVYAAKYIGSMTMMEPTSKCQIVTTMRHIRLEFKRRKMHKRRVKVNVSINEVVVHMDTTVDGCEVMMRHPICRVYYASHDNRDAKIFSYIASSGRFDPMRCNVFKAYKENQAADIVQMIGRCFTISSSLTSQQPLLTIADKSYDSTSSRRSSNTTSGFFEDSDQSVTNLGMESVHDSERVKQLLVQLHHSSSEQRAELEDVRRRLKMLETQVAGHNGQRQNRAADRQATRCSDNLKRMTNFRSVEPRLSKCCLSTQAIHCIGTRQNEETDPCNNCQNYGYEIPIPTTTGGTTTTMSHHPQLMAGPGTRHNQHAIDPASSSTHHFETSWSMIGSRAESRDRRQDMKPLHIPSHIY